MRLAARPSVAPRAFIPALLFILTLPTAGAGAQTPAPAPAPGPEQVRAAYTKYEYMVPMRDGVRLFTAVYAPKDASRTYPFLITRTPYSVAPYGVDSYPNTLGPSEQFQKEGFIFVYQDARGRYMSEGDVPAGAGRSSPRKAPNDVDESTDTYDTIEWLLRMSPDHNGTRRHGRGISQPGFHVAASIIDSHPALKAASPQAPTADYYMGDDVYHNGAFMLGANFGFYSGFVAREAGARAARSRRCAFDPGTADMLRLLPAHRGPARNGERRLFGGRRVTGRRLSTTRPTTSSGRSGRCGGSWTA